MKTRQLKHHINNTGDSAKFLIDSIDTKLIKRFDKACNDLNKVLSEIKSHYPDACIKADTQKLFLYIGEKDMGDYVSGAYGKYSLTYNPEFVASSKTIDDMDILI